MSEWKQLNFFNKYLTDTIFGSFDAYPYGYEYACVFVYQYSQLFDF